MKSSLGSGGKGLGLGKAARRHRYNNIDVSNCSYRTGVYHVATANLLRFRKLLKDNLLAITRNDIRSVESTSTKAAHGMSHLGIECLVLRSSFCLD